MGWMMDKRYRMLFDLRFVWVGLSLGDGADGVDCELCGVKNELQMQIENAGLVAWIGIVMGW